MIAVKLFQSETEKDRAATPGCSTCAVTVGLKEKRVTDTAPTIGDTAFLLP